MRIGPGAVIGYEGFGFVPSAEGPVGLCIDEDTALLRLCHQAPRPLRDEKELQPDRDVRQLRSPDLDAHRVREEDGLAVLDPGLGKDG